MSTNGFGGNFIQELTAEEAQKLKEQFTRQTEERRVYVADAMKSNPYYGAPVEQKREVVRHILDNIVEKAPHRRDVNNFAEHELDNVLVAAQELEQVSKDVDAIYEAEMAKGPDAFKIS